MSSSEKTDDADESRELLLQTAGLQGGTITWVIVPSRKACRVEPPFPGLRDFSRAGEATLEKVETHPGAKDEEIRDLPLMGGRESGRTGKNHREEVPVWEVQVPATHTLVYRSPFTLYAVDLISPSREKGFSDFTLLTAASPSAVPAEPIIRQVTLSSCVEGTQRFHWRLLLEPIRVECVSLVFRKGTIREPGKVYLECLNLWGRRDRPAER